MSDKVTAFLPWDEIEEAAQQQILNITKLPILSGNVVIMPDCHFGKGATVGSVIPTYRAIIPAAVGVDIGCGMEALKLDIKAHELPDNLCTIFDDLNKAIPLGAGGAHANYPFSRIFERNGKRDIGR